MTKVQGSVVVSCLLLVVVARTNLASAQAGTLDSTFGTKGTVLTSLGTNANGVKNSVNGAASAVLQPNGDIVVAATVWVGFALARYLPSGKLDTTFGTHGYTVTTLGAYGAASEALAIQGDGKIVVVGETSDSQGATQFAVARFTSKGALDSTFGKGGVATAPFLSQPQEATAVLVQPDGKIIVGGNVDVPCNCGGYGGGNPNTALARFNSNGTLDTSFGSGGTVVPSSGFGVSEIALDAAGSVFVLEPNGENTGFGGIAEFSSSGVEYTSVTPAPITADSGHSFYGNGQFVLANSVEIRRGFEDIQAIRYEAAGPIDGSFNNSPFQYVSTGSSSYSYGNAFLQPNGQIVVAGDEWNSTVFFGLARLNSDGSFDTSFGNGGTVTTVFPKRQAYASCAVTQADGKIIVVGEAQDNTGVGDLALARYLAK